MNEQNIKLIILYIILIGVMLSTGTILYKDKDERKLQKENPGLYTFYLVCFGFSSIFLIYSFATLIIVFLNNYNK
jgi:hypothetical protein